MRILGVDFTSSPSKRKPITAAWCCLEPTVLQVDSVELLRSLEGFESLLREPGPWIGAFDFPFALPKEFVQQVAKDAWKEHTGVICGQTRQSFVAAVEEFMSARAAGNKRPARYVDRLAGSASSLNVVRPPVGKMFFEGARRLLEAGVSVEPCCPNGDTRIALEAYPKLVTRWLGVASYKSDGRRPDEQRRHARVSIVEAFDDGRVHARYGVQVLVPEELKSRLVDDESGDQVDAVLCAIQAAWASRQPNYGIPLNCESQEGWIVDPSVLEKHSR